MLDRYFSLAICQNQVVIYTYKRINGNEVNDKLYKYDIQATDDGYEPYALKESVKINHWGSLLSKEPLIVDENGWFYLETNVNFHEYPFIALTEKDYLKHSSSELTLLIDNYTNINLHYGNQSLL